MSGLVQNRWLPAIFLFAALPAAPQAKLAFSGSNVGAGSAVITDESADIPLGDRAQQSEPELTPEELGDLYMVRQRYTAAIREYLKIDNRSAADWNKLGIAYQMMYAEKEAERCYKESLKKESHNPKVFNNLATVQDQMRNFPAAEKNYRKSLKLNPKSALVHKNLGTNLLMQHQYEKGQVEFKLALAIDPSVFDDHLGPKINDPAPKDEHGTAAYFKAKSCALAGLNDCAIRFLQRAFDEGSATVKKVSEEEDFARLRGTPELQRLLANEQ